MSSCERIPKPIPNCASWVRCLHSVVAVDCGDSYRPVAPRADGAARGWSCRPREKSRPGLVLFNTTSRLFKKLEFSSKSIRERSRLLLRQVALSHASKSRGEQVALGRRDRQLRSQLSRSLDSTFGSRGFQLFCANFCLASFAAAR